MKRLLLLLCLLASLGRAESAPGEWIVGWKSDALAGRGAPKGADERQTLLDSLGAGVLRQLPQLDAVAIRLTPSAESTALTALRADARVAYVEPNSLFKASGFNDSLYVGGFQPYLDQSKATQAFIAWDLGQISLPDQVTVAVIDSGLSPHSELSGQSLTGMSFIPGDNSILDTYGHGTFVSGIIAASTSNSAGVAGTFFASNKIKILPVRVLNGSGIATLDTVAASLLWTADQGVRVINMSLGSSASSRTLEEAVAYARGRGAFIVAAAGNDDTSTSYPAALGAVFAVGALDSAGSRAYYGNFGKMELSAYGGSDTGPSISNCVASPAGFGSRFWGLCPNLNYYVAEQGTSFAAPQVAAAAALLLSQNSARSAEDLSVILTQSADPTAYGAGWNQNAGWGQLNIYKALTYGRGAAASKLKAYNWPNPFDPGLDDRTNITVLLEKPVEVKIRIIDNGGDLVWEKTLPEGQAYAGMNLIPWDGKNGAGTLVANGSYICVVEADSKRVTCRIAVLRRNP